MIGEIVWRKVEFPPEVLSYEEFRLYQKSQLGQILGGYGQYARRTNNGIQIDTKQIISFNAEELDPNYDTIVWYSDNEIPEEYRFLVA